MKVAVPVKDDTLQFFGNAGHTPYFAVYTVKGAGIVITSYSIHYTKLYDHRRPPQGTAPRQQRKQERCPEKPANRP